MIKTYIRGYNLKHNGINPLFKYLIKTYIREFNLKHIAKRLLGQQQKFSHSKSMEVYPQTRYSKLLDNHFKQKQHQRIKATQLKQKQNLLCKFRNTQEKYCQGSKSKETSLRKTKIYNTQI